jgi:hypothetical protein
MITISIMRLKHLSVEPKFESSEPKEGDVMQNIADEIHAKQGVRKQDIWISLVDSGREDWSFGIGEMQYAPK